MICHLYITLDTKVGAALTWAYVTIPTKLTFIWTCLSSLGFVINNQKLVQNLYAVWIKEPDDPKWNYHSTQKNGDIKVALHWKWTESSVWERR